MKSKEMAILDKLYRKYTEEAAKYDSLQKLWLWFKARSNQIWEPYHREILKITEGGAEPDAELRDQIIERLGCRKKQVLLHRVYETMVKELIGRSAEKLLERGSVDYKEIIEKYDKVWQELAKK